MLNFNPNLVRCQRYYPGENHPHDGQAFPPDNSGCQAGMLDLVSCRHSTPPKRFACPPGLPCDSMTEGENPCST
jgi:hypothetical protein